ncbi:acetate uptake transporter [Carboxylicivirga marina]|uniref:Acetate uptake transporter n=1 Tax=Carboxylicivirga marina TaxID=2800988 RepID=A0ABS1HFP2_9BACT|nr:acetate uptake transporter [Carboxylicivirga marina]MBK3516382.1 acetate uptake transporter [Carboxylicivirga marina]
MEQKVFIAKDVTTNPAPLGLAGFGLTTILLNLHNAGLFGLDTMIMGMGIMMGGLIQILVGMLEWKKNNMFGMMAFSSYGAFWISLVFIWIFPKMGLGEAPSATAMGYYLTVWGIYTVGFWVATFKMTKTMMFLFATVVVLFALLAIANFTGSHLIHTIAGIEGVICGATALYISIGTLLVEVYGKQILPMPY